MCISCGMEARTEEGEADEEHADEHHEVGQGVGLLERTGRVALHRALAARHDLRNRETEGEHGHGEGLGVFTRDSGIQLMTRQSVAL